MCHEDMAGILKFSKVTIALHEIYISNRCFVVRTRDKPNDDHFLARLLTDGGFGIDLKSRHRKTAG
jgi:hypothetical protein